MVYMKLTDFPENTQLADLFDAPTNYVATTEHNWLLTIELLRNALTAEQFTAYLADTGTGAVRFRLD